MQRVGAIRKIDEVGRIVIPHDLRKNFCINAHDPLEIYTDLDLIILKKYAIENKKIIKIKKKCLLFFF